MLELLLNLTWAVVAVAAMGYAARRRDRRVLAAAFCAVALLFPIISASDDMLRVDRTLEDGFAVILAFAAILFALVVVAMIRADVHVSPEFALTVHADPRSPPAL